ncbi:vitelline membrane protein Vm32E-like [Lucilia cuprina]|uniref:vitelline membrane protein Vm32E-like n=1 Tax=Lucilia cuprina TaxID=7375 RepID=UPI001F06A8AA|nr:vitelline membrane protein Vm32E-like [Lucilia cuprina]
MKSLIVFVLLAFICFEVAVSAGAYSGGGGGASIPSPPCPKNYLFGCQPVVTTAPCGANKKPSCGGSAAYSHHIPRYLEAPWNVLYAYQTHYPLIPQHI